MPSFSSKLLAINLLGLVLFYSTVNSKSDDDDGPCAAGQSVEEAEAWVTNGGFIILLIVVFQMFWALALICEDFFVPALRVFCEEFNIPDDVAGATFMAAGASSPELFTAMIGLLLYNSNIGVGTVVGSEIFNHMMISTGSVLFAKKGVLILDTRVITRDLAAYVASLMLLTWALKDSVYKSIGRAFNPNSWEECLDVTIVHSIVLIMFYCLYATIAGNYQTLELFFCRRPEPEVISDTEASDTKIVDSSSSSSSSEEEGEEEEEKKSNILISPADFSAGAAPVEELLRKTFAHKSPEMRASEVDRAQLIRNKTLEIRSSISDFRIGDIELSMVPKGVGLKGNEKLEMIDLYPELETELSVEERSVPGMPEGMLYDVYAWVGMAPARDLGMIKKGKNTLKCYVQVFGDIIGLDALPEINRWMLKWCTIDCFGLHFTSYPEDHETGAHVQLVDITHVSQVVVSNRKNLELLILFSDESPIVSLKAPTKEIYEEIIKALSERVTKIKSMSDEQRASLLDHAKNTLWEDDPIIHEHPHDLTHWPIRGHYTTLWFGMCYPLRFCFQHTLVDVRFSDENRKRYPAMCAYCIIYLAVLSYIMILCCDYIGAWIGTTPTVMGLTLSAVGTSFPNLVSSMVVARQGYGSMAIGNALGSNIFNILIALAVPWFFKTAIGGPYREMKDHSIVMFILLLFFVSIIWYALLYYHKMRMYAWMGWLFVPMYFIVIIAAISMS